MLKTPVGQTIELDERAPGILAATREELFREHERIKADFHSAFTLLLHTEIHPALLRFLDRVRSQGHHLELDAATHKDFEHYLHRSFFVRIHARPRPVVFTFAANHDHRKIFVYTEYNSSTTINVYDPTQINEPLLERIVLKGLERIVAAQ